jgi:hypothetical protein
LSSRPCAAFWPASSGLILAAALAGACCTGPAAVLAAKPYSSAQISSALRRFALHGCAFDG